MADDQGQKITSIDDLVNELTKKNSSGPIPPPPSSGPVPSFPKPSANPPQMAPSAPTPQSEILPTQPERSSATESRTLDSSSKSDTDLGRIGAKPRFTPPSSPLPTTPPTEQAKPIPTPMLPPTQPPLTGGPAPAGRPAPIKEYQSSIRTMKDDISTLKQGQKPAGISVPRKIETPPPSALSGGGGLPKPVALPPTSGQFKVPSVNLGQAERTGPLPQVKGPTPPISRPAPAPQKSPIYAPPPPRGVSGGRNRLFVIIAGVMVLFGALYWFLIIRPQAPSIVEETPTPTPTATPTPDLSSILVDLESQTVLILPESTVEDFITGFISGPILGNQFKKIYLSENDTSGNITRVLDDLNITYPAQLKESLGSDSFVLMYGQKEIFDSKGQIKTDVVVEKRLVFISEVTDIVIVNKLGEVWETEMANNLKTIFQFDSKKQASQDFMDNSYRGVSIRYKNFPYADRSIDYAIVSALNGKSYLVIANSREAMFSTIDKLMGF